MKKTFILLLFIVLACRSYGHIFGPLAVCVGNSTTLSDSTVSGDTWTSSNPSVATIGFTTGLVNGISVGTTTITHTIGSTTETAVFTVSALPSPVTGGTSPICAGSSTTLSCASTGGTWYSSNYSVASVDGVTGVVTGHSGGTATIRYTVAGGCSSSAIVTVNASVPDSLYGSISVCVGSTTTFTCSTPGGIWSSSNASIATINSTGVATGVAPGTATISYTLGSCSGASRTKDIYVTASTYAGTLSGATTVTSGSSTYLYATVSGGTWSSSDPSVATVTGGTVTGMSAGTATITYAVMGCTGVAYATSVVTVVAANMISGNILFTGVPCYNSIRVWLIKYNSTTHMLTACDSQTVWTGSGGTSAYYQFNGVGTDAYRVKAAVDSTVTGTGYTPTYHTSSAYWSSAAIINHTAGTDDIHKDITMGYGTVTSGPGFIAGDVTMGANKGTSDIIPAVGLLIYAVDATTGNILQQAVTNSAGHYSFSNLPVGQTYKIYPELINYATTPYMVTLTSGAPSVSSARFMQHTISNTITPLVDGGVGSTAASNIGLAVSPNPISGLANVQWSIPAAEQAKVMITDVTGREVYTTTLALTAGSGSTQLDLHMLNNGVYIMNFSSKTVSHIYKIQIQH